MRHRTTRKVARSAILIVLLWSGLPAGQAPRTAPSVPPYDTLTAEQQRVVPRAVYDGGDELFRIDLVAVTTLLAAISLSDSENGEILGVALDLIERVEPAGASRVPGNDSIAVPVVLASGARDRLRRASEFERITSGAANADLPIVYRHTGSPELTFALGLEGSRGVVRLPAPPRAAR